MEKITVATTNNMITKAKEKLKSKDNVLGE